MNKEDLLRSEFGVPDVLANNWVPGENAVAGEWYVLVKHSVSGGWYVLANVADMGPERLKYWCGLSVSGPFLVFVDCSMLEGSSSPEMWGLKLR